MTKEEIIKLASETAINVYIKKHEQQRRNQAKHAIENTKRLLREYQNLKTHCEEAIFYCGGFGAYIPWSNSY